MPLPPVKVLGGKPIPLVSWAMSEGGPIPLGPRKMSILEPCLRTLATTNWTYAHASFVLCGPLLLSGRPYLKCCCSSLGGCCQDGLEWQAFLTDSTARRCASRWLCDQRGLEISSEASRGSQRLPEAPRGSHRLPETPRGSQRLPEAPRGFQRLPEAPRYEISCFSNTVLWLPYLLL